MPVDAAEAVKIDLSTEILRSSGAIRLRVMGTSMLPALWPGDELTIATQSCDSVTRGDIVLCRINDRFVIHRLIDKSNTPNCGSRLITRGDSMPHPDHPIEGSHLLGRVASISPNGRIITSRKFLLPLLRAVGLLLCHCPSLRSLALRTNEKIKQRFVLRPRRFRTSTIPN